MHQPLRSSFGDQPLHILLVDDNPADRALISHRLEGIAAPKLTLTHAPTVSGALVRLDDSPIDICLVDYDLGNGETALDLYRTARKRLHLMPFIVITGALDEDTMTAGLLTAGIDDVVLKDSLEGANLYRVVRNSFLRNRYLRTVVETSSFDDLTGALNRRAMKQRLELDCLNALRQRIPVAMLFLDMDDFKSINDYYGHFAGDEALVHMTRVLESLARRTDAVCRPSGDEFVVILPGATLQIAMVLRDRIIDTLASTPLRFAKDSFTLSASIGISIFDPAIEMIEIDEMLARADASMYAAKQASKTASRTNRRAPRNLTETLTPS